jgi:hypothetical protein
LVLKIPLLGIKVVEYDLFEEWEGANLRMGVEE